MSTPYIKPTQPRRVGKSVLTAFAIAFASIIAVVGGANVQQANAAAMTGFTQVSVGNSFTCAVKSDGTVWCWGRNNVGQLGNGTTINASRPVQVSGLTGATQVAAAETQACAVKSDGRVWCWGGGRLGNGSAAGSTVPVQVSDLTTATQISGNYSHFCALKADASVVCWGWNILYNLGDGTTTDRLVPTALSPALPMGALQVSAGVFGTSVLLTDGTVRSWGAGNNGALGNGSTTYSTSTKTAPTGLSTVSKISGGPGWGNLCAIETVGRVVKCWGLNNNGQLGIGVMAASGADYWRLTPVAVTGFTSAVTSIDAGIYTPCAVLADTSLMCWGYNGQGQAGVSGTQVLTPTAVPNMTGVSQVSTGYYHSCAVLSDTTVKCWGSNTYGALGNGSTTNSVAAVSVLAPAVTLSTPTSVTASATTSTEKSIDVSWTASSNASSYTVKIYNGAGSSVLGTKTSVTGTSTSVTASTYSAIADNTAYKITVTAIGDTGQSYNDSLESSQVSVTTNLVAATPTISSQPVAANRTVGQSVTFSVTASVSDGGTLSYQWLKNTVAITNATSSSYSANPVAAADAANYSVTITNAVVGGISKSVTSTAVALTIASALSIATPTTGLTGTAHSVFSLAVAGSGGRTSLAYALTGTLVSGLSLSTSTGTISGTPTATGTSTVSVTVTDANGATASTSSFTLSIGYASTTVSLALAASSPTYGTVDRITATTSRAGTVNFMVGGVSISGCSSVATATTTATCDWIPTTVGVAALSAQFTPTTSTYSNSTTSLSPSVQLRALTITPTTGLSKVYGASDPTLTYSISSGSLYSTDVLTGALSRASGENVNTYSITGGSLGNANYALTFIPATFRITQATQASLTLTSTSGTYGTDVSLAATGGSGGGALSYVVTSTGTAGCSISSGNLLSATTPGTCTVTATRAATTNYLVESSIATTVTIARQTQTALNVSTVTGDVYTGIIVSSSGGSGTGAVSYGVTTGTANCALTSGVVTARTVGTCLLTVTKAADTYYLATSESFTLSFGKAIPVAGQISNPTTGTAGTEITLSFTGGSGTGAVTYAVLSPGTAKCVIANGKLVASASGSCTVTTTKQGDDTYPDQVVTTEFTFSAGQIAVPTVPEETTTTTITATTTTTVVAGKTGKKTVVTTSTTAPTTTTTSTTVVAGKNSGNPAPDLLNTASAQGAATIGGKTAKATTTRVNNQLIFTAGTFTVTFAGVNADGSVIPLRTDGVLELAREDMFRLDAKGFAPGTEVIVWMFSQPQRLTKLTVGADGLVHTALRVPKSLNDGLHHVVMVGVDQNKKEAKFEFGLDVGVPAKQWWVSRVLLVIPISVAVFIGLWLPTSVRRRRKQLI